MSKQRQSKPSSATRERENKPQTVQPAPHPGESAFVGRLSTGEQASLLSDPALPLPQRRAYAKSIGRAQGNRHLQRTVAALRQRTAPTDLISRLPMEERTPIQGLSAAAFNIKVAKPPAPAGAYKTSREGEGAEGILKVEAPEITMDATVSLNENFKFEEGDSVKVGPVQTLTSSERTGVYVKDGKEIAQHTDTLAMARDARPLKYAGDKETFSAERPFYDQTQPINNSTWDANVNFIDQPKIALPLEFAGGHLTRIEGADQFVTSIGIKSNKTGQIITVSPFGWRANWSMTLDAGMGVAKDEKGESTAKGIETWEEAAGLVVDTDTYAAQIFKNNSPVYTFLTLDAAMSQPAPVLWMVLAAARQRGPDSIQFIEQALTAKNPNFQVTLQVSRSANRGLLGGAGSDAISLFANAGKQSPLKGPFQIAEGNSTTIAIPMSEILDPASITAASKLSIWAGGDAILGDFLELPYPFLLGGEISVSSASGGAGTYAIFVGM